MALVFMDSFSGYTTNAVAVMLWDPGSGGNGPGSVGTGRFGGDSRSFAFRDGFVTVPALDTYIMSFAVNFSGISGTTYFAAFQDGTTRHLSFNLVGGKITVWKGTENSGTQLAQATRAVRSGLWYHVQIKAKIDNSAGTVEVRVDGSASNAKGIPATASLDTQNGGSAQITRCYINTAINNLDAFFSDFLLLDTTGAVNNTFPGDNKITIRFPTGAGSHTQFTPSAGSNYQNVDDPTPDGDATYNSDATVGHKDSFTHTSLAVTGTLIGVKHNFMHRKDNAGLREISSLCRSGGNDYTSATVFTCGSNYFMDYEMYELDPDTGIPWVASDLDSAEFGLEVIT